MMKRFLLMLGVTISLMVSAIAQDAPVILSGAELTRVVPTSFYYEQQSAPTQMRNTAAARFGAKRLVIAGLVDTSGYSTEVQARYQGFFITDSRITVGGAELGTGAYGFGFGAGNKFNIYDVGGNPVASGSTANDSALRRPRPLMMTKAADGVRLYAGRAYVTIAAK